MEEKNWARELAERTGISFCATRPEEIEAESMARIRNRLGEDFLASYPDDQLSVLCRVIHTTADFSYRETLTFTPGVMETAARAVRRGLPIITDTTMAAAGINKSAAGKHGISVSCFIGDEDVREEAKRTGMTRSAVSVDKAARQAPECIYVVGNAPTALMRLYELIEDGRIRPAFLVGAPVGFVNVTEAKELILRTSVPSIVARGQKGGSNVAAAICNAILYRA